MTSFTHLHVHTEHSLLDGLSRIPQLVDRAAEMGMDSLAITDHGALYGLVDFYSYCREKGVKPIIGCEIYVAQGNYKSKAPNEKSPYHLTVLAIDNTGYRNLVQLVTHAHLEGYYYRPRVDKELLERYNNGLIALSGCPSAEIPRSLAQGQLEEAKRQIQWYKEVFSDRFYLEIQRHEHVPMLPNINEGLIWLNKETGIPLVVTNDSHYTQKSDSPLQDILICIHTNTTIKNEKRLRMEDDSYYLKSAEEMSALFPDMPQALEITHEISQRCNVTLDFGRLHLPQFVPPDGMTADQYLVKLCWEGFKRRFPDPRPEEEKRLKYELEVIKQTRFSNYFLVVWDIAAFAYKYNILFGVRGSAAASLALYCLDVTQVNPLEYKLVFERFLNLERKEMPDIDMDFQDDRRGEVLSYLTQRYGLNKVAQIITFGTLGPKAAVRDVGRAMGMTYADVDRVARQIPFRVRSLSEALEASAELKELYEADESIRNLVDTARSLEGIVHHVSTHAAGVVISEDSLSEYVPLQHPVRADENNQMAMTQYAMDPIAKLGLLKMDVLGLTNLTILDRTIKVIQKTRGQNIDLHSIPLDDDKTFKLLSSGHTTDIFQLESPGMQRYIKELQPSSMSDVAAMIALYRPGPMEQIDRFIKSKHGLEPPRYPHPALEEILRDTYGVIVYQDQVLFILQSFAGYTLGQADIVRKAMGKKIPELMRKERERFIQGAVTKGFSEPLATQVFDLIEPFAGYAFNKAHSVSYALIAYWTAYFKANYAPEYMCSVLNSRLGNTEKVVSAISECFRIGLKVLGPDVNHSDVHFSLEQDVTGVTALHFGLSAVKNVGEMAVRPIIAARQQGGTFSTIEDFCGRVGQGLSRRTLESLIKVGAFDSLGDRGTLLASVDMLIATAQREARRRQSGQVSMFEAAGGALAQLEKIPVEGETSLSEKALWENEFLGVAFSLSGLALNAPPEVIYSLDQLVDMPDNQQVKVRGLVISVAERLNREQRSFFSVTLLLLGGKLEVLVWPGFLEKTRDLWQEGILLEIVGKKRSRGSEISLHCDSAEPFQSTSNGQKSQKEMTQESRPLNNHTSSVSRTLHIRLNESESQEEDRMRLQELIRMLLEFPGQDRIYLEIATRGKTVRMEMPNLLTTGFCPELEQRLNSLLGPGSFRLAEGLLNTAK